MATSLIKTAQALGTAAEQLQSAEFVRSTVRDFDLRRATAIEAHVVRSTASVCSRRLLAPLASNVEAAPAASKAAPRKEVPTVGMSPKTLKRKFNDCIGAMERDVEAFDLGDQSAVVQSMKAAFEGESTAVRNLRQRLEGQAAEAEASAAAERGQPASLVTRDAIHARVASKTQSLANAKRKSEQLKAERKALGEAKGCAEQEQDLGHEPTDEPEQATAAVTPAEDVEALEELEELDAELEQLRSKVQAEASRVEDLRCVLVSVRESEPTAELQAVEGENQNHSTGENEGEGEGEPAKEAQIEGLRRAMFARQAREEALCQSNEDAIALVDALSAAAQKARTIGSLTEASRAETRQAKAMLRNAVACFAPTSAHAAALQLLADNKGEMTLDELKAGTDIKPKFIYEMVANSLIQIDRSCMPNRVVSLIA